MGSGSIFTTRFEPGCCLLMIIQCQGENREKHMCVCRICFEALLVFLLYGEDTAFKPKMALEDCTILSLPRFVINFNSVLALPQLYPIDDEWNFCDPSSNEIVFMWFQLRSSHMSQTHLYLAR